MISFRGQKRPGPLPLPPPPPLLAFKWRVWGYFSRAYHHILAFWEKFFPLQTFQNYVLSLQGFILRCDYCVKNLEGDLLFQFVPSPPAMAPSHPVTTQGQVTPSSSTTLPLSVGANRGHSFSMPDTGSLKRPSQVRDLFLSVALQGKLSSSADNSLDSQYLSDRHFIQSVRRIYILITPGSQKVKDAVSWTK